MRPSMIQSSQSPLLRSPRDFGEESVFGAAFFADAHLRSTLDDRGTSAISFGLSLIRSLSLCDIVLPHCFSLGQTLTTSWMVMCEANASGRSAVPVAMCTMRTTSTILRSRPWAHRKASRAPLQQPRVSLSPILLFSLWPSFPFSPSHVPSHSLRLC